MPVLNPPGRLLKQVGSGKGGIDRAEAREGKFAVDSPVEGAVTSEPVSEAQNSLLAYREFR